MEASGEVRYDGASVHWVQMSSRVTIDGCPMQIMPWVVSVGLIVAGLFFTANSARSYSSHETHWGYTLTGLTCILLGTGFAFLIWNRSTGPRPKGGTSHPLE